MNTVAIIDYMFDFDIYNNIISKLPADSDITIFTQNVDKYTNTDIKVVKLNGTTESAAHNNIIRYYRGSTTCKYLHIIDNNVIIENNPTMFMQKIEALMDVLDLNSWFNCSNDQLNYVYKKLNPRFYVNVDNPEYQKFNISQILFCSHSNTAWTTYNIQNGTDNDLYLNEEYCTPVFYISEFLARRRNTKQPGQLYYMNYYPTIPEETHVFKTNNKPEPPNKDLAVKQLQHDDLIFKQANVDFKPDTSIDVVLIDLYEKLQSKV